MNNNTLKMPDRNLDYKQLKQDIPAWIREKANWANAKSLIVWVSGWIDSAVISTMCAISWKAVIALEMPIHQKGDEVSRAKKHITWLKNRFKNVTSKIIDLTPIYDAMLKLQPDWINKDAEYLANVNLRSRLRASQLYSTANRNAWLVVWTWNKVEDYGIWFFTKYWDWAVDISPNWELYKSEVYKTAKELDIIKEIQQAKPTDWLHPNWATDEDQIWASYDELEWAMIEYDNGKRANDFINRAKEVMQIYQNRHKVNAHKMNMPPIFEIK